MSTLLSRVWRVVTWVVGPQHHAVRSGKNIWESGFSLMEEGDLCLLPRLFQRGMLLVWKCSLSCEEERGMDKNIKFQLLQQRSGTGSGTWPGTMQALGFGWKNKWLINAIQGRDLEKEMATHSSVLARRILWTEEPGGLPSMGSHRVAHDWSDLAAAVT